jgi:hypothetical protein
MELEKNIIFKFNDLRCEFRTLNESDITEEYVNGLNKYNENIINIQNHVSISSQKKYINDVLHSKGDTIFGFFVNNELVGTAGIQSSPSFQQSIKFPAKDFSSIGLFIFNKKFRKTGLGKILVWATTYLYSNCTQKEWFSAGMKIKNISSLKSFLGCGYRKIFQDEIDCIVFLHIAEFKTPEFINDVSLRFRSSLVSENNHH